MSVYDYVRCLVPIEGIQTPTTEIVFQSKNTEVQFMDDYEIREDGLWHKAYDVEDRSNPKAEGLARIIGAMTRVNERWEKEYFDGSIEFHGCLTERDLDSWVYCTAIFEKGKLVKVRKLVTEQEALEQER